MNVKLLLLVSSFTLLGNMAMAGPCTDRIADLEKSLSAQDAGSGPTAKTQSSGGDVAATPRKVPKAGETPETGGTPAMNSAVGNRAASPADVRAQTEGTPTAAQAAQSGGGGMSNMAEISAAMKTAKSADAQGNAAECGKALDQADKLIKG